MKLIKALIALFLFFGITLGADGFHIYHKDGLAVTACETLIGKTALYFSEEDHIGYCNVKLQQALGTMAHCLKQIPHEGGIKKFIEDCSAFNLTEQEFEASYENATIYLTNVTADPNFNLTKLYYLPAQLSQKKVQGAWDSSIGRYYNYNIASWYGIALISYWFFVILASGICKLTYFIFPNFVKSLNGSFSKMFRRFISLPATGRKAHAHHKSFLKVFQWIVPTRLETILIAGWWLMALVFNVVHYRHDSPNLFWPKSKSAEIGRKIADRTGIMSLYLIPTLILFAGRNNFLQWLSGWSYSRFLLVHKWIARAAVLLVMLHAIGLTYNGKGVGKYEDRNKRNYVRWGYVSFVAGCIMCFHSLLVFRRSQYELFLLSHIVLAVMFIVGGWIHCEDQGFQQWYYAATAVWCFDRAIRIARLAAFGVHTAEVELKANETLRVTVPRPAYWKPFPGCHAFIYFLRPSCFWQSHPFTIVDSVTESGSKITFYLKVKGGVTHGLYQYLSRQPGQKAQIKVTVEGPYGQRTPIDRYDNAVFIAGGNGIPGLYYEATDIAKKSKTNQRIRFYWIVRHYRSIEWFYEELLKLKGSTIEPIVYVTQPHLGLIDPIIPDGLNSSEEEEEEQEKKLDAPKEFSDYITDLKSSFSFIEFREGRPDILELVKQEIDESNGSIAFATCGHATMVDDARKSIVDNLSTSSHRVELFEQVQSW